MEQKKIFQYFEQNPDLRVLFVFDPLGDRIREIESFAWQTPYRVERFAGDWFVTKCRIADMVADEKLLLLLPLESPLGVEERMRTFPLLGELCANAAYIDDDYHAFMTLHGLPTSCSMFVRNHLGDLQLAKFDKVLGPYYGANFTSEIGCRGILSVLLGEGSVREWKEIFARIMVLDEGADSKKKDTFFAALFNPMRYSDVLAVLQERLKQHLGAELDPNKDPHMAKAAIHLRYNTVVQNLPTCEADHYKSCRVTDGIVINRMNLFLQYAAELPENKRNEFFNAFEKLSADIHMLHLTDVYGADADYGAYPPALCREILAKLAAQDVVKNAVGIRDRARSISSRAEAGLRMRSVASFLVTCAEFYMALSKVKTFKLNAPNEYVFTYASEWFELDRSYRLALERFYGIQRDEDRQIVEGLKKKLDGDYWVKIGESNAAWMDSLRTFGGTNKLAMFTLQGGIHKEIGDDSVKHAVIISDGLRYEVAKEIEERVNSGRHKAVLKPGIAMLPSETKYCKPVLMPHQTVDFIQTNDCDVRLDDKWVVSMADRQAQLLDYWPDGACVDAAKLTQMTRAEKRTLFKKPIVYVYHDVIDHNGHGPNTTGKDVAEACRKTVDELVQLITSIHSTYNVADVLLVSDHGFLLNDLNFDDKDKIPVPPTENAKEKTTRYYLTQSSGEVHGVTKFALKDVSEMNDTTMVAVPDGTARFAAPGGYVYAHGGASLQEIIIPILRSQSLRPDAREKVGISLVDNKLQVTSSQLKVKLLQDDVATATLQGRTVVCGLYANDKLVTAEKTVVFDLTDPDPNERIKVVELVLTENPGTGILQLRICDEGDRLNPIYQVSVTNCTLIERDF